MSEHDKPVGMFSKFSSGVWHEVMPGSGGAIPLYTRPAQWVGLTDEEVDAVVNGNITITDSRLADAVYGVVLSCEAKLKEKNT